MDGQQIPSSNNQASSTPPLPDFSQDVPSKAVEPSVQPQVNQTPPQFIAPIKPVINQTVGINNYDVDESTIASSNGEVDSSPQQKPHVSKIIVFGGGILVLFWSAFLITMTITNLNGSKIPAGYIKTTATITKVTGSTCVVSLQFVDNQGRTEQLNNIQPPTFNNGRDLSCNNDLSKGSPLPIAYNPSSPNIKPLIAPKNSAKIGYQFLVVDVLILSAVIYFIIGFVRKRNKQP